MLPPDQFPFCNAEGCLRTSPATDTYNCIAWAAGDSERWWWPDRARDFYWPNDIPEKTTVYAFLKLFRSLGYESCDSSDLENGFVKVAIYALENKVTHAARQLPSGKWTSKMGRAIDIEHNTLKAIEGPVYGQAVKYLKKAQQHT